MYDKCNDVKVNVEVMKDENVKLLCKLNFFVFIKFFLYSDVFKNGTKLKPRK